MTIRTDEHGVLRGNADDAGALCITEKSPHGVPGSSYRRMVSQQGAPGPLKLRWDGHPLSWTRVGQRVHFAVPADLVRAHRVAELRLKSYTRWWEPVHGLRTGAPP